jgi:hypothetical protein
MFVPSTSGDIVSNDDLRGFTGSGTTIHIEAPQVRVEVKGSHNLTADDVQKAVERGIEKMSDIIDKKLRRSSNAAFSSTGFGDA